jgi:hypothetical protein
MKNLKISDPLHADLNTMRKREGMLLTALAERLLRLGLDMMKTRKKAGAGR